MKKNTEWRVVLSTTMSMFSKWNSSFKHALLSSWKSMQYQIHPFFFWLQRHWLASQVLMGLIKPIFNNVWILCLICTSIFDWKSLEACLTYLVPSLILSFCVINCGSSSDISIYVFANFSWILSTDKLPLVKMGWHAFLLSRFSINLNQFLFLAFRTVFQLSWFEMITCNLNFLTC